MPKYTIDRELKDVLSRATALYPKLVARRTAIAAELASVEAALARLDRLSGSWGPARARPSAAPTAPTRSRGKSLTAKRLREPVLAVLTELAKPVGSAEIMKALDAKGIVAATFPLQVALKRLRDDGHVRASGKARRFSYALAPGRRNT